MLADRGHCRRAPPGPRWPRPPGGRRAVPIRARRARARTPPTTSPRPPRLPSSPEPRLRHQSASDRASPRAPSAIGLRQPGKDCDHAPRLRMVGAGVSGSRTVRRQRAAGRIRQPAPDPPGFLRPNPPRPRCPPGGGPAVDGARFEIWRVASGCLQRLLQVVDQVLRVLDADREADEAVGDARASRGSPAAPRRGS